MSIPMPTLWWEPIADGVVISLDVPVAGGFSFQAPMTSVREFRDDMEEAAFFARGFEKIDIFMREIEPGDQIRLLGDNYTVQNTLSHGLDWIIQFEPNAWHDGHFEVTLPADKQVTVYRSCA